MTLTWAGAVLFGALPFLLAERPLSFTDAVFETASGLTATASTVYVGLDQAPRGLLLWRFLLAWLGGFGLVTFAVLVLPYLRVGGLQLFMVDLSARPGKFLPRTAEVVAQIAAVYLVLTLAGAVSFGAAGSLARRTSQALIQKGLLTFYQLSVRRKRMILPGYVNSLGCWVRISFS